MVGLFLLTLIWQEANGYGRSRVQIPVFIVEAHANIFVPIFFFATKQQLVADYLINVS